MNESNLLNYTTSQLRKVYNRNFPWLVALATGCTDITQFTEELRSYIKNKDNPAAEQILIMLDYEGKSVYELSMGKQLDINSFAHLWNFLKGNLSDSITTDILLDFYHLFSQMENPFYIVPDKKLLKRWMRRWETGLDGEVMGIREKSKDRIICCLIKKIERRTSPHSKYLFPEGICYEEKYSIVLKWWNEARFHLAMAIKSPTELNWFLGESLSAETMSILISARKKGIPFFVTPYYLSLLNIENEGFDDSTIRTYIVYSRNLVETYGQIRAWEKEDIVVGGEPNAAGWLLPEGHNIHRRYPEVAIFIPDSMGRACGGLCALCQRMYDFQKGHLNFNLDRLKPTDGWEVKMERLMMYYEHDSQLRDILITGGDALMSQNQTLERILDAVFRMAVRKRELNKRRGKGKKYAEIQRVRLGSRLLAYLPNRVNDGLIEVLKRFREKAEQVGIQQFFIQTHFESPLEVTEEVIHAARCLLEAGWIITNQAVFTVAASRRGHTARLREVLNRIGILTYYTFSVKGFEENYALFAPNSRSVQEVLEEKVCGNLSMELEKEVLELLEYPERIPSELPGLLDKYRQPFLATDRNVMNLPGIGKSMTFQTVGMTKEGKRILRFSLDAGRRHSPQVDHEGNIYIVESKSIAAYLRQLQALGERVEDYSSLWDYAEGRTESRFALFEYPEPRIEITGDFTNLEMDS